MRITALALACAAVGTAQAGIGYVVPGDYASAPGTGVFLGPLSSSARTYQLLIHESLLTDLVGLQLNGLSFRSSSGSTTPWPAIDATYGDYDIYLSNSVDPSARSFTFADNVVGTQTQVRDGALSIAAGSYGFGGSPTNPFGPTIGFDSNYTYTGGNLLVEIRQTGSDTGSRAVDALTSTTSGYGTLFSATWASGATATTDGLQGNFSIIQFTAVPAPASGAILGLGLLAARRRR
jgi:hypothetical protein